MPRLDLPPPGQSWRDYEHIQSVNRARKSPTHIRNHSVATRVYRDRVELDPYDLVAVCIQYNTSASYDVINKYTDALANRIRQSTGIQRVRRNFSEQAMDDVIRYSKGWYKSSSINGVVAGSAFDWGIWLQRDRDKDIQQLMLDTAEHMFGGKD